MEKNSKKTNWLKGLREFLLSCLGESPHEKALFNACEKGNLPEIKKLISKRLVNIETTDKNDATPLVLAAENGHLKIVQYLINQGADKEGIEDNYEKKETPLMSAAKNGHLTIVQYLVEYGANKEAEDNMGNTPLMYAVFNENLETIKYLVEQGADKDARGHFGLTPLETAVWSKNLETVKYLVKNGASITKFALHEAKNQTIKKYLKRVRHFKKLTLEQKIKLITRTKKYIDSCLPIIIIDLTKKTLLKKINNNHFTTIHKLHQSIKKQVTEQNIQKDFGIINKNINKTGVLQLLQWCLSVANENKIDTSDKNVSKIWIQQRLRYCLSFLTCDRDPDFANGAYRILLFFSLSSKHLKNDLQERINYLLEKTFCNKNAINTLEFKFDNGYRQMNIPKFLLVQTIGKKDTKKTIVTKLKVVKKFKNEAQKKRFAQPTVKQKEVTSMFGLCC